MLGQIFPNLDAASLSDRISVSTREQCGVVRLATSSTIGNSGVPLAGIFLFGGRVLLFRYRPARFGRGLFRLRIHQGGADPGRVVDRARVAQQTMTSPRLQPFEIG
jgi:hypothetical protein